MSYAPIALTIPQYDSETLASWWLKAYEQGTVNPLSMATDAAAGTLLAKCQLDSEGFPVTAGAARFIPFIDGDYDLWCFPTESEADFDDTTNAIQFADNLNADPSKNNVIPIDNVADLKLFEGEFDNQRVSLQSYYDGVVGGGQELFWDATSTETANDGTIFQVTGVVTGRWKSVDTSVINVKMFGIKGDNVADDTLAWQSLADYLQVENAKIIGNPTDQYKITTQINVKSDINFEANGAQFKPVGCNGLIVGADAAGIATTLSADAQINKNLVVFTSVVGFAEGDLVKLKSTVAWMLDPTPTESMKKGETHIIQRISGNNVYFEGLLFDNYDVAGETVTVTLIEKVKPIITSLGITYDTPEDRVGIEIRGAVDGVIDGCFTSDARTQGINVAESYNSHIVRPVITSSNNSGTGYGVQINDSAKCHVFYGKFSECRRGVDLSGTIPTRGCKIWHNDADGSGLDSTGADMQANSGSSGFGSHETSEHNSFKFNTVSGARYGFILRGKDEVVDNNECYQDILISIVQLSKAINFTVENNKYRASLRPGKTLDVVAADDDEQKAPWFVSMTDPAVDGGFYKVRNNDFDDLKNSFMRITITTGAPFTTLSKMTITGNTGRLTGSTASTTAYILEADDQVFTISDSYITNNNIREDTSQLIAYHPSITIDYQNTVEVDNVLIPVADIVNGGGGGTLTVTNQKLVLNVKDGVVTIAGFIEFDITVATTIVKLENLPTKTVGSIGPAYGFPFVEGITTAAVGASGMVAMPAGTSGSIPTSAWLSSDHLAYNTGWAIGTGYKVPVSFSYYTDRRVS